MKNILSKKKALSIAFMLVIVIVVLVSCTKEDSQKTNTFTGTCDSEPFVRAGVQVEFPFLPIALVIDSNGLNFKVQPEVHLNFVFFELEPYLTFENSKYSTSPCLKVEIFNPAWDNGGVKRYLINYHKQDYFQVRLKTGEYTDFYFTQDNWMAGSPGEPKLIKYDNVTNTLFIDASRFQNEEIIITPEIPNYINKNYFCTYSLTKNNNGFSKKPCQLISAFFQDSVNLARVSIKNQFSSPISDIIIICLIIAVPLFTLIRCVKIVHRITFWTFFRYLILTFIWLFFWIYVYIAPSLCWLN